MQKSTLPLTFDERVHQCTKEFDSHCDNVDKQIEISRVHMWMISRVPRRSTNCNLLCNRTQKKSSFNLSRRRKKIRIKPKRISSLTIKSKLIITGLSHQMNFTASFEFDNKREFYCQQFNSFVGRIDWKSWRKTLQINCFIFASTNRFLCRFCRLSLDRSQIYASL